MLITSSYASGFDPQQ